MTKKQKGFNFSIPLFFKGIAMGIADVIPGVSGGTIAVIVGVYQQFIESLSLVHYSWLKLFLTLNWKKLWSIEAFRFLINLGSGILCAIILGAKLISYLLIVAPEMLWAFFMGLVIGAIFLLMQKENKRVTSYVFYTLGTATAWFLTSAVHISFPEGLISTFFSGILAICAMLLPGISGSYILLIIGKYHHIINAVKAPFSEGHLQVILAFIAGAVVGLLTMSHFIKWLLKKYEHFTMMTLIGFMTGALPKLWPWNQAEFIPNLYHFMVVAIGLISIIGIIILDKKMRELTRT